MQGQFIFHITYKTDVVGEKEETMSECVMHRRSIVVHYKLPHKQCTVSLSSTCQYMLLTNQESVIGYSNLLNVTQLKLKRIEAITVNQSF